jgi:hypothetical protein
MKMRFIFTLCVIALFGLNSIAQVTAPRTKDPGKPYKQSDYPQLRAGGETIATAVVIDDLPYIDGGTTCGAADDYAANCGCCGGSNGSPDLVYAYTPEHNGTITIHETGFDTFLEVRDADGNLIACDDDSGGSLTAQITALPVIHDVTYYIIVEGYGAYCGDYTLTVSPAGPDEIPLSGWAIGIGIFLILSVAIIRYVKLT